MSLLQTKNLSISLGRKNLFEQLDLTFKPGEIWGILGPNGAGKTTLLHILAGLQHSNTGTVFLNDHLIHQMKPKLRAQKIGLLFQNVVFPFPISVLEAVLVGRHPYSTHWFKDSKKDIDIARDILKKMRLLDFESRFVSTLSGGEKQRLALAALFAQEPDIYLLDEPTSSLDMAEKVYALNELKTLAKEKNKTIIMILHDIHLIRKYCDQLLILDGESPRHISGKTTEILTKTQLKDFFPEDIFDFYGIM